MAQLEVWAGKNGIITGDLQTQEGRENLMNSDKVIKLLNSEVCGPRSLAHII
jgi:hypothetical protein